MVFVRKVGSFVLCSGVLGAGCGSAGAATSLLATGHAGFVGQYIGGTPPQNGNYSGMQVPLGLTLEASPNDNLVVRLGLDYAYSNYPVNPTLLGQTTATSTTNPSGQYTPMPFANAIYAQNGSGGVAAGQKVDNLALTTAYFGYQTPVGYLRAGRMPRHWGLGVWYSDQWSPTSATISTTDAVSLLTDLNLFDVQVYYERYGESVGGSSGGGSALAYSAEVRLKTDPADPPSTGISREVGVAFSKFSHSQSNTSLNIFDLYGKFYVSRFFAGGEILYPSGSTQNPNYQSLGGAPECNVTLPNQNQSKVQTCNAQNFSAIAFLLKGKWQLGDGEQASVQATEAAQTSFGTAERAETHVLESWVGYASGGGNQFNNADNTAYGTSTSNNVSAVFMNPNIQPAFLMFSQTAPAINGMPTGSITNTTFAKASYTYESPHFGSLTPSVTWARLNRLNPNFTAKNPTCIAGPNISSGVPINHVCVGGSHALGAEFDIGYQYTTLDRVLVGADAGYWFVGDAWKTQGSSSPNGSYGTRVYTGVQF